VLTGAFYAYALTLLVLVWLPLFIPIWNWLFKFNRLWIPGIDYVVVVLKGL
jgi:hypothetical protein